MKIKVYENKWHDIPFDKLKVNLTSSKKASLEFYNNFYERFFLLYNGYNELSKEWLKGKIGVAKIIEKKLSIGSDVLSYGCGIGFIEKYIAEIRDDIKLDCYDYSTNASKWIKNQKRINFITDVKKLKKYDTIFMVELLYSFNNEEILQLLNNLKKLLNKNGQIIISNTSLKPRENGLVEKNIITQIYKFIKDHTRPFYFSLFKNKKIQFWGYQRDKQEYEKLFYLSGYKPKENFNGTEKLFQIFSLN